MKRIISLCCAFFVTFSCVAYAETQNLNTSAKSVLLMEQSTGEVLYENNADEKLPIASVTKIMTLLLIMEAIDSGKITMEDVVTVSENAMSMGGSTMFLETGEQLSVYELLKGIAVASANDGCVAMAEFLSGSEDAFVAEMNKRAAELGMTNTNFVNTNGLDDDNHYSSARDVALMSKELLKHDKIFEFTTIWTDTMNNGKYDLANTNKLIRFYRGANGLKTGSTSEALCCLSASALRDDMQLIAIVLASPTSQERFNDARVLLDYGFANYCVKKCVKKGEEVSDLAVKKGVNPYINVVAKEQFSLLIKKGESGEIKSETVLPEYVKAPVKKGETIGKIIFTRGEEKLGETELVAGEDVMKKSFTSYFKDILNMLFS